jgi:nucleotide-binding universal stress UspA family protein
MQRVLVPVDGSESSARAVQYLIAFVRRCGSTEVHLLNVQAPALRTESQDYREPGELALRAARTLLEQSGVPYACEVRRGLVEATITHYVKENQCDAIIMGTRGMGTTELMLGSVATKVVYLADVPVTLIK